MTRFSWLRERVAAWAPEPWVLAWILRARRRGTLDRQRLGRWGERWVARRLRRAGWRLFGQRVSVPAGEIDLVAEHGDALVLIEVKSGWWSPEHGAKSAAVQPASSTGAGFSVSVPAECHFAGAPASLSLAPSSTAPVAPLAELEPADSILADSIRAQSIRAATQPSVSIPGESIPLGSKDSISKTSTSRTSKAGATTPLPVTAPSADEPAKTGVRWRPADRFSWEQFSRYERALPQIRSRLGRAPHPKDRIDLIEVLWSDGARRPTLLHQSGISFPTSRGRWSQNPDSIQADSFE